MPQLITVTLSNGNSAVADPLEKDIQIIDPTNNTVIKTFEAGEFISAMLALPNNQIIISYPFPTDSFQVYDTETGKCVKEISQGGFGVDAMVLLPGNTHILAGGADKKDTIRNVNLSNGTIEKEYSQYSFGVSAIHLYADTNTFAVGSCSNEANIRIINLHDGSLIKSIKQSSPITTTVELENQIFTHYLPTLNLNAGAPNLWSSAPNVTSGQKISNVEEKPNYQP